MSNSWDVIVVGAGAAGLVAAFRAAEMGKRTLLLEKNRRPGVKILMSGGTRCNLTQATDNRGIVAAYGPPGRFLHSALAALSVQDSIAVFEEEGVKTKVEETGKVFPISDKAADVLEALLARLHRSGAELALDEPVTAATRDDPGFRLTTPKRALAASRLILTTGGKSYPGSGTTGDGYQWAADLGHTIVSPRPALTPLTTNAAWVLALKGITLERVTLTILDVGKKLASRTSSLLFSHFGLTGPAALDVSRVVSGHPQPASLVAEIDLVPDDNENQLGERLRSELAASGKKNIATIVAAMVPQRLADAMLQQASIPADRRAAEVSKDERNRLLRLLKHLSVPLTGTLGFGKAEVTAGGISLVEVDSRTMQSKLAPGLYFAGEILDLDGPIGGYNFQAAWSTGWLAGTSAASR
jgi:predicted Rossmann fold flavoprotein